MHPASTKSALGKLTRRWVGSVGLAAAVGSTYFLVAYLSLSGMFCLASEGITLFWAAAGISSGLLIALGSPARWPVVAGVFLAAFAIPFIILGPRSAGPLHGAFFESLLPSAKARCGRDFFGEHHLPGVLCEYLG